MADGLARSGRSRGYYRIPIREFKGVFNAKHKLREEALAPDHHRLYLYNSDGIGDSRELS